MAGVASSGVRILLRVEGLGVFVVSLLAYAEFGGGWGIFALFFLAPDLSLFGYLAGPRVGTMPYNFTHSFIGALAVSAVGVVLSILVAITAGIIWMAHIGFDRSSGYGLKYSAGFGFTHLGLIGQQAPDNSFKRKSLRGSAYSRRQAAPSHLPAPPSKTLLQGD